MLMLLLAGTFSVLLAILGAGAAAAMAIGARFGGQKESFALRFSLGSVGSVLLLLNLNSWVPGAYLFPAAAALGAVAMAAFLIRSSDRDAKRLVVTAFLTGFVLCAIFQTGWLWMFVSRAYWMLEGTNHDMVFFYGGAKWVTEHAAFVGQSELLERWQIGTCSQGMQMIGSGCPVYRGGTYTLMAFGGYWLPDAGPNALRSTISLIGLFPLIGFIGLRGAAMPSARAERLRALAILLASAAICLSAGMLCSVVNENLGTAFGAAALAMLLIQAAMPTQSPASKAVLLGMGAAVGAWMYGEAAVYACWLVAVGVIRDAWTLKRPLWVIQGGVLAAAVFLAGLNVLVIDLYQSVATVSGLVTSVAWSSWFISAAPVTWFAAPFAGLFMGGGAHVSTLALVLGFLLSGITLWMGLKQPERIVTLGLVVLSAALVFFIESKGYQYGEHKIIELLAPLWSACLCSMLFRRWQASAEEGMPTMQAAIGAVVCGALLLLLSLNYLHRSRDVLLAHRVSALGYEFPLQLARVKPGDEVVIDVSSTVNDVRYVKQDLAAIDVHRRGGKVLLPNKVDDSLTAYSERVLRDSFRRSRTPDWLVQFKSPFAGSVIHTDLLPVSESAEVAVYDLRNGTKPLVLAGPGWHACETDRCWTKRAYGLEAYVPRSCKSGARLSVNQELFMPLADGVVKVRVSGSERNVPVNEASTLDVGLPAGWSTIEVEAGWEVKSPLQAGLSADGRELFAGLRRVDIRCN